MWKFTLLLLLLIYGAARYWSNSENPKAPAVPDDQYWGTRESHSEDKTIRPFKIDVKQEVIDDLKMRLSRTQSLRKPLEDIGWIYGVDSEHLQTVLEYWRTKYDWTKRQSLLNNYSQFETSIQGLDIHFYHVKPRIIEDSSIRVLPLLLVHGWPGSIVEFQRIIPLLTIPRDDRDFIFELIIPSLPGYGFSDPAARPGLGSTQVSQKLKRIYVYEQTSQRLNKWVNFGNYIRCIMAVDGLFHSKACRSNLTLIFFLSQSTDRKHRY
ncbi:juvenile hormone epoxide hydrolase 2-like [Neodiprion fabricii]|uniref:juvenile hormone epoxide hydrolase 2-like n=1 Tax=Neodiprion fabricii TaxID=2872261 RepID=UPI001ED964A1|nr:juvenile hormone epoxide hydrolase 2-like [Neodiprion fabricii]